MGKPFYFVCMTNRTTATKTTQKQKNKRSNSLQTRAENGKKLLQILIN